MKSVILIPVLAAAIFTMTGCGAQNKLSGSSNGSRKPERSSTPEPNWDLVKTRNANLGFYKAFHHANQQFVNHSNSSVQSILSAIQRTATKISMASSTNVDPMLVNIASDYVQTVYLLRGCLLEVAQNRSSQGVTGDLFESFLRGANGDPFGKTLEMMQRDRRLSQRISLLANQLDSIIARANSRAVQLGIVASK